MSTWSGTNLVLSGGVGVTLSLTSDTLGFAVLTTSGVVSLNSSTGQLTLVAGNNFSVSNNASTVSLINLLSSSASAAVVASASNAGAQSSLYALVDHAHAGVGAMGVSTNQSGDTGTRFGTWLFDVSAVTGGSSVFYLSASSGAGVHTLYIVRGT